MSFDLRGDATMVTAVKERPILFSGPMVRAILSGQKTQTRRVVKRVYDYAGYWIELGEDGRWYDGNEDVRSPLVCPYGKRGERLWVRETFVTGYPADNGYLRTTDENGDDIDEQAWYRATEPDFEWLTPDGEMTDRVPWKPSIFMSRRHSRILLEITEVRVERLNAISEKDCWAEGIDEIDGVHSNADIGNMANRLGCCIDDAKPTYACLWESIHGKGSWDANSWVWVVTFRKVE